ncbi:DUF1059 domain-containing protein [Aurantimonas sp. 22II-16-19i]|uniref:DUF1059 domain-containing protein n=1 Tax=Aurantimonas sp. 22II-16-19i TaxID=1317114 RepID=UPI0009F7F9D9|nr:DUF1059 domain-containing protein [Aurantimonas sp. 22II-16-19i]ORE98650.1 hypothetical protein ATO4_04020 [Aurantimonas sp. 22II-16-19i]
MYELDCSTVFPACERVIRADTKAGVIRRAIAQAQALGIERITPSLMDSLREKTIERPESDVRAA